jgi:hypothetical protein
MLIRPLAILAVALLPAGAEAASCSLSGWSTDTDPAGLNVRAEPSAKARIVGVLPAESFEGAEEGDPPLATEVDIVGSENGWLLIERAAVPDYEGSSRTVFEGRGWVSGRFITFSVEDPRVRSAPSRSAGVIAEANGGEGEWINVRRVLSCTGEWAEVEAEVGITGGGRKVRGFVRNTCGNQLTTCGTGSD